MSLSCSCDFDDDGEADWYWWPPNEYSEYKMKRKARCCCECCNNMIAYGAITGTVRRTRSGTEWEDDRGIAYMDDPESKSLANAYMCERCTDLYFSFVELGFDCVSPYEDMIQLAKDYHEQYQSSRS